MLTQAERRQYLIRSLLNEEPRIQNRPAPATEDEEKRLLRALLNLRPPKPVSEAFLQVQDDYLQEAAREKGIVRLPELSFSQEGVALWQGDITRLAVDAIVNAANSGLTGCYLPNHTCIDNCIHTFAGVQMRLACAEIVREQGCEEPAGQAKLTPGYNLPCRYVLHTVGPIIQERVRQEDEETLAACYRSCLELAEKNGLKSVAFCCISTGVFRFPNQRAAEIAVETVRKFLTEHPMKILFNVFKDEDYAIYNELLSR